MTAAKTCTICGEDCSNRPRIKDKSGKYACRACYEERLAEAEALRGGEPVDSLAETRVDQDAIEDDLPFEPHDTYHDDQDQSDDDQYAESLDLDVPAEPVSRPATRQPTRPRQPDLAASSSASGTHAFADDTQSASFHDLEAILDQPDDDVCPRCGKLVSRKDEECQHCGARLADFGDVAALDRLTEMGFLFTEDGAWHHGARLILGIFTILAIGSALSVIINDTVAYGFLFAGAALVALMTAVAWLWATYTAWRAGSTPWAVGLFLAYPIAGPGTLLALYHAYFVTANKRLRNYHTLLILCAVITAAGAGIYAADQAGMFSDEPQDATGRAPSTAASPNAQDAANP